MSMVESALAYAEHGWHVFPLLVGGKLPIIPNAHPKGDPDRGRCHGECGRLGHGFHDSTTDPVRIAGWWAREPRANIGVRTGAPSNLAVVDVDPAEHGTDSLGRLEEAIGVLPGTVTQDTPGKHDDYGQRWPGIHFLYAHPGRPVITKPRAFGPDMPGLDVKGDGGYIVVAPSVHPEGGRYRWAAADGYRGDPAWTLPLAPWPTILSDLLEPEPVVQPRAKAYKPKVVSLRGGAADKRLAGACTKLATETQGNRNHLLYWTARVGAEVITQWGLDPFLVAEQIRDAARAAGLADDEIDRTIDSAFSRDGLVSA